MGFSNVPHSQAPTLLSFSLVEKLPLTSGSVLSCVAFVRGVALAEFFLVSLRHPNSYFSFAPLCCNLCLGRLNFSNLFLVHGVQEIFNK